MGPTRFFFTRHGEAIHNPLINAKRKAEGRAILDPELTDLGIKQAKTLQEQVKQQVPEIAVVITSPLTRALQTTQLAFGSDVKVVVTPLHTESGFAVEGDPVAGNPCQRGKAATELQQQFPPQWDWSALEDESLWTTTATSGIT